MPTNFELQRLKGTLLLKWGEMAAYIILGAALIVIVLALIFDRRGVALNPSAPLVVLLLSHASYVPTNFQLKRSKGTYL